MLKSETYLFIESFYKSNRIIFLSNLKNKENLTSFELKNKIYPNKITMLKKNIVQLFVDIKSITKNNIYLLDIKDDKKLSIIANLNTIGFVNQKPIICNLSDFLNSKKVFISNIKNTIYKLIKYLEKIHE